MEAMQRRVCRALPLGLAVLAALPASRAAGQSGGAVEFNRDIRPILSNHCFVCHGPDYNLRKAKLRLDVEKQAHARVLVVGRPDESELYRRVASTDPDERMPPSKTHKPLAREQVELIRRWIEQGAKYEKHWSLLPPRPFEPPAVRDKAWPRNAIDNFILARLEKEGLRPSPEADKRTLLRRLYFDLIGLPPSPAEVEAFANDPAPEAYERVVDQLLASEHFGERMAMYWLDLVRYADTGGYHSDNHRDVAMYRDWVIAAFNKDVPFDRFTVEQLAGDLLPGATLEQKIASGYNRLLQTTEEGGAQPKEYTAKYAADRVRNLSSVWMGLTMGCCECHDHKFDPFTTKEFYKLEAFFADIQEKAVGRQDQTPLPTPEQAATLKKLDEQIAGLQKRLADLGKGQEKWEAEAKAKAVGLPKEVAATLNVEPAKRNPQQKEALTKFYRSTDPATAPAQKEMDDAQKQKATLVQSIPKTLVSMAGPPRVIRVLPRGNWLDDSGMVVLPDVPAALPPLPEAKKRYDRLDLAQWLVAPQNPLTARVFVNRLWHLTFGQGLVKTLEDFGSQGAWPTHPELFDWLAIDFRTHGWDVKRALKQIVLSSAYRQASKGSPELLARDPYNQLLARQARFRLDAELVRDNALAISGLLVLRAGGPSVKPYQPAGYWAYLNFPTREWANDVGEDQYRRGLYTYWQRTFLHPSLLAFDAPTREECTVERARSNTPQQALVLLNDPTYVEAARVFAARVLRKGGADAAARIDYAFREALQRPARPEEVKVLTALVEKHRQSYAQDPAAAQALLKVGQSPVPADIPAPELAAWTSVTRAILNLHEMITRN
jgi:mono/diheme cytochrome c family protein